MSNNTSGLTPGGPGRPLGSKNAATQEIRAFSEDMITSPTYVAKLRDRLEAGKAPHMETLLFQYAYGKPKDTTEHTGQIKLVVTWQS